MKYLENWLPMPVLDQSTGAITLPMWLVGGLLAVFVVVCITGFRRSGVLGGIGALMAVGVVVLGGWTVWNVFDRLTVREQAEARRSLDRRTIELGQQAFAPGSALACLDGTLGDQIEAMCETALFSSAESIAAAISYAHARYSLYVDSAELAGRDPDYESKAAALRVPLEADRYGVVAQMLALRYGCTAARCDAAAAFHDPARIEANLKDRPFEVFVTRFAPSWSTPTKSAAVSSAPSPAAPSTPASSVPRDFPSSASIPPVSIMNAEPGAAPAGNQASAPNTPVPPRRPAPTRWSAQPGQARAAPPAQPTLSPAGDNGQSSR